MKDTGIAKLWNEYSPIGGKTKSTKGKMDRPTLLKTEYEG